MRVKAKAVGFYGQLRDVNEEFDIAGKEELGRWMEVVSEAQPKAKPGQKPAAKPDEKPEDNLPDA